MFCSNFMKSSIHPTKFVCIFFLHFCRCEDALNNEFSCYFKERLPFPFDAHTRRITIIFKPLSLESDFILYAIDRNGRSLSMLVNQEILHVLIDKGTYYYNIKQMCGTEGILRTPFHVHFLYDGRNVDVSCGDKAVASPDMSQPIGIAKDEYPPYIPSDYPHAAGVIYIGHNICNDSWNKNNICLEDLRCDKLSLISKYKKDYILSRNPECIQNEIIARTTVNPLGTYNQISPEIKTSTTNTLVVCSDNHYLIIMFIVIIILLVVIIVLLVTKWTIYIRFKQRFGKQKRTIGQETSNEVLLEDGANKPLNLSKHR